MNLPMLGTPEKTASSRFQITLVDKTNRQLHPMDYPRIHRFFDNMNDRNTFIQLFESSIIQSGGKFVHNVKQSHPLFESFTILNKEGEVGYDITVYR